MAKVHGVAGEWARVRGSVIGLWPLGVGIFATGFSLALWVFVRPGWGAALTALSLVGVIVSLMSGLRHVERFFKGARGEERVAGILRRLPADYHVFNDFVVGSEHIDHVVVGPTGVYAVETKFWKGAVTLEDDDILVGGHLPSRSPLKQVMREAKLVREALSRLGWSGPVTPVIAFAGDNFEARIGEIGEAVLINACDLGESFERGRQTMTAAELGRLVGLMEV